jgi:hypothetical protein
VVVRGAEVPGSNPRASPPTAYAILILIWLWLARFGLTYGIYIWLYYMVYNMLFIWFGIMVCAIYTYGWFITYGFGIFMVWHMVGFGLYGLDFGYMAWFNNI